jgi:hypothetical protein
MSSCGFASLVGKIDLGHPHLWTDEIDVEGDLGKDVSKLIPDGGRQRRFGSCSYDEDSNDLEIGLGSSDGMEELAEG